MDIVEQCRKAKEYNLFDADVYEQAADEIERLRKENAKLKEEVEDLENRLIEAAEMADYYG